MRPSLSPIFVIRWSFPTISARLPNSGYHAFVRAETWLKYFAAVFFSWPASSCLSIFLFSPSMARVFIDHGLLRLDVFKLLLDM